MGVLSAPMGSMRVHGGPQCSYGVYEGQWGSLVLLWGLWGSLVLLWGLWGSSVLLLGCWGGEWGPERLYGGPGHCYAILKEQPPPPFLPINHS